MPSPAPLADTTCLRGLQPRVLAGLCQFRTEHQAKDRRPRNGKPNVAAADGPEPIDRVDSLHTRCLRANGCHHLVEAGGSDGSQQFRLAAKVMIGGRMRDLGPPRNGPQRKGFDAMLLDDGQPRLD